MKSFPRLALTFLLVASAVLFCNVAFAADPSSGPDAPQSLAALWPMLGLAIGNLNAYLSRRLSSAFTFFHTGPGAMLLSLEGAAIASVVPLIQAHGFVWAMLAWAALGGVTSFLATLNPSTTSEDPPAKSPSARPGAAMLLPLVFMAAMTLPLAGCPGPGTDVLKKCELGQLPAIEQSVLAEVGVVILNPASVLADLVAFAAQLGPGQVACAVQAWDAYLASKQPSSVGGLMAATSTDQRAHALSLTRAFLMQHPATACSGRVTL